MPVIVCTSPTEAGPALEGSAAPVILVPVYDAYDDVVRCLESVRRHTPAECALLVVDDASRDPRLKTLPDLVAGAAEQAIILRHAHNQGFVRSVNEAFAAAGRRDVVIVNSDVVVGPQWLERLRDAAYADARIATATPLTNHGTIVSVPERNLPGDLPPGYTPDAAAAAVAGGASRLRPALPTCIGHCTYVKRMALDLAGPFDETFSPGYGEEVDFSQRCALLGLVHVCADDVFVYHRGSGSFGTSPETIRLREAHESILADRYPHYHQWVGWTANGKGTTLGIAIGAARRALVGLTVTVDVTGTPAASRDDVRSAVCALAAHPSVARVRVVGLDGEAAPHALHGVAKVALVDPAPFDGDVVYRPAPVAQREELERARTWGARLVLTGPELALFGNPGAWESWHAWARFRDLARLTVAMADALVFPSRYAEAEARDIGLLSPGKVSHAIAPGIDDGPTEAPPPGAVESDFVLCVGADRLHDNRVLALRVFTRMAGGGYAGRLVFAGPAVAYGASRAQEVEYLRAHPALAGRVVSLGDVDGPGLAWLCRRARLVLHLTLRDPVGLLPSRAALVGTPCLASRIDALGEVLPASAEVIEEWDAAAIAERALGLLADRGRRTALVGALATRAREFTWAQTAAALVDAFQATCRTRTGPRVTAIEGELGVIGAGEATAPDGDRPLFDLLGQGYPPEFHQAMRAVAQRASLRRPVVGVSVLAYRLASALRTTVAHARGRRTPSESG